MMPNITLSTVDYNRIELILQKLPASHASRDALEDELQRATLVEPWDMPPRVVTMHSRVRFRLAGSGAEYCKTLVYPKDAGRQDDSLSVLSPVGSALIGLAEGDQIAWAHPDGGTIGVEVLEILYQPERAGDLHL